MHETFHYFWIFNPGICLPLWDKIRLQELCYLKSLYMYLVAKYVTFWNEGTLVRTAPVQDVGVLLKSNNSKNLGKGLPYVCNLLLLTNKFYIQNQPPKCRVEGYKFRSVYAINKQPKTLSRIFHARSLNLGHGTLLSKWHSVSPSSLLKLVHYVNEPRKWYCNL